MFSFIPVLQMIINKNKIIALEDFITTLKGANYLYINCLD